MAVALKVELFVSGAYVDITTEVRVDPGVTIRHGVGGESGLAAPAEVRLSINNASGKYSPRNPTSPYYGLIGRNTPLRVSVGTDVRAVVEVAEWPQRWEKSSRVAWTPIVANGVLRRLGIGSNIGSPLTLAIAGLVPRYSQITGYWPMEDGPGATAFASGIGGGNPGTMYGTPLPGTVPLDTIPSDPIASFGPGDTAVLVASGVAGTGLTLGVLISMPAGGITDGTELIRVEMAGTLRTFALIYNTAFGGSIRVKAWNVSGSVVLDTIPAGFGFSFVDLDRYVVVELVNNGTGVDWGVTIIGTAFATATIAAAQVTTPSYALVGYPAGFSAEVGIGQVVLGNTNNALFKTEFIAGMSAFLGETVLARLARLTADAGVALSTVSGSYLAGDMGPEDSGDALSLMRVAEAADAGGILCDDITAIGLRYITRNALYSDTTVSSVTLSYTAGRLSEPLDPTDDDANLRNDITVTRTGGSSARATLLSGPLNANPYPAGVGGYEASSDLNVATDALLPHLAGWLLHLGTVDETRYPAVTVDLVKNSSLAASVSALRPGSKITLTNLPGWLPPGGAELLVLGWTEVITDANRIITLNCAPASPYRVQELNDTLYGRLDSLTTVTSGSLTTTATTVNFTGDTWVTTAANPTEFPFGILIGGEEMTVTAATASAFTVVRSVNGVVKTHATAAPIRLAVPTVLAL